METQTEEEIANEIIDEILNEAGIKELADLDLQERQPHERFKGYWDSDKDFLAYGDNHRAATILLGIYLRSKSRVKSQVK